MRVHLIERLGGKELLILGVVLLILVSLGLRKLETIDSAHTNEGLYWTKLYETPNVPGCSFHILPNDILCARWGVYKDWNGVVREVRHVQYIDRARVYEEDYLIVYAKDKADKEIAHDEHKNKSHGNLWINDPKVQKRLQEYREAGGP